MLKSFLIGTYTTGTKSEGVYRAVLQDGQLTLTGLAFQANDPSYLLRAGGGRLYWVDEALGSPSGQLGFAIDANGAWEPVAQAPTLGENPCHLALSPENRWIAVANYTSGSVSIFSLNSDGSPTLYALMPGKQGSADSIRQAGPHAHFVSFQNGELWCCDLGGDLLRRFILEGEKWHEKNPLLCFPAGSGPRHMVAKGELGYFVCELSSEILVYHLISGELLSRTPCVWSREIAGMAAAIRLDRDGTLLVSHRGGNCVSIFSLSDPGHPARLESASVGARDPRDILPIGSDLLCACQTGNAVTLLTREKSGKLRLRGQIEVPSPVCVISEQPSLQA